MSDPTAAADARRQFKSDVLDLIGDLGRMTRFVVDHLDLPCPAPDVFVPNTWTLYVKSRGEFDHLAAVLSDGCPVEFVDHVSYRAARRRFGAVCVEVWWPASDPPAETTAATGEGVVS